MAGLAVRGEPPVARVHYITHPDVTIDPARPIPSWPLSPLGRAQMAGIAAAPELAQVKSVWSSDEVKAMDGAAILAAARGLRPRALAALGETDRSATGYLPRPEFERVARAFLDRPAEAARGWERAVDVRARTVAALIRVCRASPPGDIAVVGHGGTGALLYGHLLGQPISARHGAPGLGARFVFDRASWRLTTVWIAPPDPVGSAEPSRGA